MLKRCPICGKPIESTATKCKHCNSKIIDTNIKYVWQDGSKTNSPFKFKIKPIMLLFIFATIFAIFIGFYFYPTLTDARDWEYTVRLNNKEVYFDYVNKHKKGQHIKEAWNILDKCCWQKAIEKNSEEAFLFYLKKFPNGMYRKKAERNAEELAWKKACESGDKKLIRGYIKNYPNGIFIKCAKFKLKE